MYNTTKNLFNHLLDYTPSINYINKFVSKLADNGISELSNNIRNLAMLTVLLPATSFSYCNSNG